MPVPASVKKLLDNKNVSYHLTQTAEALSSVDQSLRQQGATKSTILQDAQGRIQVVIAANCLLDLNATNKVLNRQLRPATTGELKPFFDQHQFHSLPSVPRLEGMPTLIDKRLLEIDRLYLDGGTEDELIEIDQATFQNLISDATTADIAVPVTTLEQVEGINDEQAIAHSIQNFTQLRIKQRLEETLELPPLPDTAQRIIKLRVDPNADINDLANIVETDASLAAQVVSWAASPYYSAPGKIKSIHDAIVRVLGFDMVLNLALGLALSKTLSLPKSGPHGVMPYWHQSIYTAAVVEGLVTAIPREHRPGFGMAYLSGLLHNFGYLILAEVFPPYFDSICRHIEANSHISPQLVDKQVIGVSRDQLASWLMKVWSMPDEVVVALKHQNNPQYDGEYCEYSLLLFVAQRLLQQRGVCLGPKLEIPESVFERLHLDQEKANLTVDNILASSADLDQIAMQFGT